MDIRQLRYFMAVVEEGTISAAAKKLHLSQPPLSKQMKMLEEEYGVPLFERGSRHIRITQAGSTLYRYASEIVDLAGAAADELSGLRAGKFGTLRIGMVSSCRSEVLDRALHRFREERPEFRFRVTEGNTYELLEKIRKFEIELALVRTPYPETGLEQIQLGEERMVVAGPAALIAAGRDGGAAPKGSASPDEMTPYPATPDLFLPEPLSLEALSGVPLIIYRRWETLLHDRFRVRDIEPRVVCTCDDARTALQWAAAGLGAAVLPSALLARDVAASRPDWIIRGLSDEKLMTRLTCVRLREAAHTSQSDRLFRILEEENEKKSSRQGPA